MKTYYYLLKFDYKACSYITDTQFFSVNDEYLSPEELRSYQKGSDLAKKLLRRVSYKTKCNPRIVPTAFEWKNKVTNLGLHTYDSYWLSNKIEDMEHCEASFKKVVEAHEAKVKAKELVEEHEATEKP